MSLSASVFHSRQFLFPYFALPTSQLAVYGSFFYHAFPVLLAPLHIVPLATPSRGRKREDGSVRVSDSGICGVRPSSGTLFDIRKKTKKQYKQSVRRIKRRNKFLFSNSYSERRMDGFWLDVKKLVQQSKSQASAVDGITDPSDIGNLFANNINLLLNSNSPESQDAMHGPINIVIISCPHSKCQSIS